MSKSIKVSDGVYIALEAFRQKRESFSDVVERLLKLAALLQKAEPIIQGWQQQSFLEREFREREEAAKR